MCTLDKCIKEVKETAYFTLVRPILEYAAIIWDPYQQYLINDIEKVQHRATRWVMGGYCYTSSVSRMISALQWLSLEQRHLRNRPTMFYNLVPHYQPLITPTITTHFTMIPWSSTSYCQMSFFPKTIRDWTNLPHQIIESQSVDIFSGRLMHHH